MRLWIAPFLAFSAIGALGWNADSVAALTNPPMRRVRVTETDNSLVGQFQTSAVGHLWTYTEVYLENGVKLRKMTLDEKREYGLDDGNDHGIPIIPTRKKDFRGILGDVEREVNAWDPRQAKRRNDPKQCMPLFRLMTWLDPHFVDAWTSGAMIIGLGQSEEATSKAKEFLNEGLRNNPDNVDIPTMYAMLCIRREGDYLTAEKFLKVAIENGNARFESLSESERDELQSAFRWQTLVYRDLGQTAKMVATAMDGIQKFPEDRVLPNALKPSVLPPENYRSPAEIRARRK